MLTLYELRQICPKTPDKRLRQFVGPLNAAFEEFEINTDARQAAFLAQAAHETGGFVWLKELATGEAYERRTDLGNTVLEDGDGPRFKGRGIFQLTGEANYVDAGLALYGDPDWFRANPDLAAEPANACRTAGWYWKSRGLNELADQGDFERITRRINGGLNGHAERVDYFRTAKLALA